MIEPDYIGDDLPLSTGQSYDLCGHDDIVRAVGKVLHADIFATVMQNCTQSQQKPFPASHSVDPFDAVKNLQSDQLQCLCPLLAPFVALGSLKCACEDIFVKIMRRFDIPPAHGIIVDNPVTERHAGDPDQIGFHGLCDTFCNNRGNLKKRYFVIRYTEL